MKASPHPARAFDEVVSRLAARQHGIVTRTQLTGAGISRDVIDHRVRIRRLQPLQRGVYLVGPVAPPHAREMAACLACGPDAHLSHRSAGAVWGLLKQSRRAPVDVALPGRRRRRPGIRTHRIRTLRDDEVTRRYGIPVTTPARTLYDLAGRLRPLALETAVADALARRLTNEEELLEMVERQAGRRGVHRLKAALGRTGPAFTRSRAEELFLALARRARIEDPQVNVTVGRHEVDFYWPGARLAVEIDGRAFHASNRDFERDRRRDAELATHGIRVVRVTWEQLTSEPEAVLVRLGGALAASSGGRR